MILRHIDLYYAPDLAPNYWEKLSKYAKILLDMVKAEINKGDDDLTDWLNEQKEIIVCNHVSLEIINKYQEILQYIQNYSLYKE